MVCEVVRVAAPFCYSCSDALLCGPLCQLVISHHLFDMYTTRSTNTVLPAPSSFVLQPEAQSDLSLALREEARARHDAYFALPVSSADAGEAAGAASDGGGGKKGTFGIMHHGFMVCFMQLELVSRAASYHMFLRLLQMCMRRGRLGTQMMTCLRCCGEYRSLGDACQPRMWPPHMAETHRLLYDHVSYPLQARRAAKRAARASSRPRPQPKKPQQRRQHQRHGSSASAPPSPQLVPPYPLWSTMQSRTGSHPRRPFTPSGCCRPYGSDWTRQ